MLRTCVLYLLGPLQCACQQSTVSLEWDLGMGLSWAGCAHWLELGQYITWSYQSIPYSDGQFGDKESSVSSSGSVQGGHKRTLEIEGLGDLGLPLANQKLTTEGPSATKAPGLLSPFNVRLPLGLGRGCAAHGMLWGQRLKPIPC